jgi:hypothetical protein
MKIYLILIQIIYALSLPFWFLFWGISFMAFDNGFSNSGILFVSLISLYPVAVIGFSILSWKLRSMKRIRLAIILNFIPMIWIIWLIIIFSN